MSDEKKALRNMVRRAWDWLSRLAARLSPLQAAYDVAWLAAALAGIGWAILTPTMNLPVQSQVVLVAGILIAIWFAVKVIKAMTGNRVAAVLIQFADEARRIKTRQRADEWAHNVYNAFNALGLQAYATAWDDGHGKIINKDTDDKTAFALVRRGENWLRSTAIRVTFSNQPDVSKQNMAAYHWAFQTAAAEARTISRQAEATGFWTRLTDTFYAIGMPHLLNELKLPMRAIDAKKEDDDVSTEMLRMAHLLDAFAKITEPSGVASSSGQERALDP